MKTADNHKLYSYGNPGIDIWVWKMGIK